MVGDDLRRLGAWCLVAIAAVVLLSFRGRPRPALLSLLPVLLGSFWLLGLCGGIGLVIDPMSMTVAPLLLGIGIDDGLHALHGARAHGDLVSSLKQVGQAMTLTTLTTCIGFGTLVFSRVPSLQSGGALVAAGTALCLLATLLVLPALDALFPVRTAASGV
jgi:predicted RND superfamily exporter protein